ncbi:MAG TPA: hypothetical protein VF223_19160 [Trebonia sp.]
MNTEEIAYKLGFGARRRAEVDAQFRQRHANLAPPPPKIPLTASQHILHLLLTVFTAGLWAPVWIARAAGGNRPPAPQYRPPPQPGSHRPSQQQQPHSR